MSMTGQYAPPPLMEVVVDAGHGLVDVQADLVVVPVFENLVLPTGVDELDRVLRGRITRLLLSGEVTGQRGTYTIVHTFGELKAQRLCILGMGPGPGTTFDEIRNAAALVGHYLGRFGRSAVAWAIEDAGYLPPVERQAVAIVEGLSLGSYNPGQWRSQGAIESASISIRLRAPSAAVEKGAQWAAVVNRWVVWCRNVVNGPPNEVTPTFLADAARTIAGSTSISLEVLAGPQLERAGAGGLLAVARGSDESPYLIVLRHTAAEGRRGAPVLGLVGKGLTFDSGGLSLKPARGLQELKADMAGAAAVLAGIAAITELALKVDVIAVVAACENMPSGRALRPGEIVRTLDGTCVEVTNTDYEGRLVLADALTVAQQRGATHLLDIATLTDIAVALGDSRAGLFGNDADWIEIVRAAADQSGDHVWPMPIDAEHRELLRSDIADIKNYQDAPLPMSGLLGSAESIQGAAFLAEFARQSPWTHIDIGATGFIGATHGPYRCPGATGHGVRLVVEVARRFTEVAALRPVPDGGTDPKSLG